MDSSRFGALTSGVVLTAMAVACSAIPTGCGPSQKQDATSDLDATAGLIDGSVRDAAIADASHVNDSAHLSGAHVSPVDAGLPIECTGPTTMRIVAGNITSGNSQSYDGGEGGRIFKALAGDVVLLQEFNVSNNSAAVIRSFVDRYFGAQYSYTRGTGDIPNGVISRWPILEQGTWIDPEVSNRTHAWAKVALPGGKTLLAVSVHLKAGSAALTRAAEARALNASLASVTADYSVVGGDFNTADHIEEALSILGSVLSVKSPYPADESGNDNTSANRSKPYDRVIPSVALDAISAPAQLANKSFADGLVFDTRVFSAIPALTGDGIDAVLTTDSNAPNMQHMAVLRSFNICP